jgi:hypothetical protein
MGVVVGAGSHALSLEIFEHIPMLRGIFSTLKENQPILLDIAAFHDATVEQTIILHSSFRRGGDPPTSLQYHFQPPEPGRRAFLRVTHEKGYVSWHLPKPAKGARVPGVAAFGAEGWDFEIPHIHPDDDAKLGLFGDLGAKIIHVITFKIVEGASDELISKFAGTVEDGLVKEKLHDIYIKKDITAGEIGAGSVSLKVLALVHGIFSSTQKAFESLLANNAAFLMNLPGNYDAIIGFDHKTVTASPADNAATLNALLARRFPNRIIDLSILSHSRGGLVSRYFVEKSHNKMNRPVALVMVATPNNGTPLADSTHIERIVNAASVGLGLFHTFEYEKLVMGILKFALHGVGALPGIEAMVPNGVFLAGLNRLPNGGTTRYSIMRADFTPNGYIGRMADALWTWVFLQGGPNDLFVPWNSVPGCSPRQRFNKDFGFQGGRVSHATFFTDAQVKTNLSQLL